MGDDRVTLSHRWFEEVWNQKNEDAIDSMFAESGVAYGISTDLDAFVTGPEQFKPFFRSLVGVFPDIQITVDDTIVEGDKIAVRFTGRATHLGDGLGVTATGREVRLSGMSIVQIENDQIVTAWNIVDFAALLAQINAPEN